MGVKIYFEKEVRNDLKEIIYDLDGFDKEGFDRNGFKQDGFNKEGFDRFGFDINGFDKDGFDRNKKLVTEDKVKKAIRKNPWNNYYALDKFKDSFEIMKECVEFEPNTYQYASINLKNNVELALFFLRQGGSFSLINKHLHKLER